MSNADPILTDRPMISLKDLTPADLQSLLAQLTAAQNAEKSAAKARREQARTWLAPRVSDMVAEFGTRVMGDSGIIGQSIGGTVTVIDPTTGEPREARVSMSVKWTDTIPAREKTEDSADGSGD